MHTCTTHTGFPEASMPRPSAEGPQTPRGRRGELEDTPIGQQLSRMLGGGASNRGDTPLTDTTSNESTVSTAEVPLPPPPPPTPQGGVGGVPVPPPPPPPSLPVDSSAQAHLKRVNWEKIHSTEGTIWREVGPIPMSFTKNPS